jgi:hypothetical protein
MLHHVQESSPAFIENTATDEGKCALSHAPHTQPQCHGEMLKSKSWHSHTYILHGSHLSVVCVVTTLVGWLETQTSNLGGKGERNLQIAAFRHVAAPHLQFQNFLPAIKNI